MGSTLRGLKLGGCRVPKHGVHVKGCTNRDVGAEFRTRCQDRVLFPSKLHLRRSGAKNRVLGGMANINMPASKFSMKIYNSIGGFINPKILRSL